MVEAVLCDMDGTLLDSNRAHAESWQRALARFGIETTTDAVARQIGKGGDEMLPVFVPEDRLAEIKDDLKAAKKEIFEREYMDALRPFAQVRELVLAFRDAGIRFALASSAGGDELKAYEKMVHIEDLVEEETSSGDVKRAKPHPDIFQAALEKLKVKPDRALALGDTPYDAEAAGKAGVKTVGLTSGGWSERELLAAGCVEVYRDAADLLGRLRESAFFG